MIYIFFKAIKLLNLNKFIFTLKFRNKINNLEVNDKYKRKEFEYILNYRGTSLEPEWERVRNISFVYTWVDGSDIDLSNIKSKYNGGNRNVNSRDRSADELLYSLRSLKKYIPWHNGTIFIVTDNQIPRWLNINNSQIKIINHQEIIPKYINPTFDSSTIECFLDKIPDITDIFIYLNDDFFFNNFVHPSFFFTFGTYIPKIYRTNIEIIDKQKAEKSIQDNDIHNIYDASAYFTYKIIYEYFDRNFTYYHLAHCPYVCYRLLFEPFRQFFEEELKVVFAYRFRSAYKPITLYLYQMLLLYANKKLSFNSTYYYEEKIIDFRNRYLKNTSMSNYSFEIIPEEISLLFSRFSSVDDNSRSNFYNFNYLRTNRNILIYNINDKYNNNQSLFEFTEYLITRYPNYNIFEKENYINLEKEYLYKLKNVNKIIIGNDCHLYSGTTNYIFYNFFFNRINLNYIKEYLGEKNKLSIFPNISKKEKEELDILFNYDGRELELKWNWVKNISIVYIINESSNHTINALKYSLRSLEDYLPWFRGTIYIIDPGMSLNLSWLDINNTQIKIINPKDIVSKKFYGNYSKEIVEMFLDKIPLISERFILLNQDHYFKNFIHPRFFFNEEFYPKYNFVNEFTDKIRYISPNNESFFETYKVILNIFGSNYLHNNRFIVYSPIALYRDLFKPVRKLYLKYFLERDKQNLTLLPLYLLSTYNIYGTSQIYFPNYVAGFGEIRNMSSPLINKNKTISYYGFDITSEIVLQQSIVNIFLSKDVENNLLQLEESNILFFCIGVNKTLNEYEIKLINNFFRKLYNNKSNYEI